MKNDKTIRAAVFGAGAVAQARHLPEYAANPSAGSAGGWISRIKEGQI